NDPLFAGGLDELNIYGRALTPTEIAELQSAPAAETTAGRGDRASYDFADADTAVITDSSGQDRHATVKRTWGAPSHPGFLAAYPETQFITLESMTASNYQVVWAPYYTAHKILQGLLDAHLNTDDPQTKEQSLDLASGLCDWMHSRLSVLSDTVRQRMWDIFSSGEYGGIAESIIDVWAITQDPIHLELAGYFDHRRLLENCANDVDILDGLHGNQHIPIFNGFVRMYDATGQADYLTAARNFWPMVAEHRAYAIGGTTVNEFWRARDAVASTLTTTNNAETCCAYNMLKLSRLLFLHEQDPRYMDYYERTLVNQILGSKQDKADAEKPLVTYFIGLAAGSSRTFTPKQGTTCCEGTGMESATKYQDSVYFHAADDSALFVNLFTASRLDWSGRGITVTQETDFPFEQGTTLTVAGSGAFELLVRRPAWAQVGYRVRVNGTRVDTDDTEPGSYLSLDRSWSDGDVVTIELPFTLRMESPPDDPALRAIFFGPVHLVARRGGGELVHSLDTTTRLSGDLGDSFSPLPDKPLHFSHDGTEFAPFLEGTTDPFHSYVRNVTQRVVLGGFDSGVGNVPGPGGLTILDEIWAAAPFASKGDFVNHVREVAMQRRVRGDINTAELQRLLLAAGKAPVQP
ncbi:beta-L-arabinofuranosidase domain-containing protein, partial [Nocardioides sp.]|uniref:beta-L-arabinofuranosidase domain-containing protein n=1 Tax=Nocardioides sp. TaxID=35761 RepID=UPI002733F805